MSARRRPPEPSVEQRLKSAELFADVLWADSGRRSGWVDDLIKDVTRHGCYEVATSSPWRNGRGGAGAVSAPD